MPDGHRLRRRARAGRRGRLLGGDPARGRPARRAGDPGRPRLDPDPDAAPAAADRAPPSWSAGCSRPRAPARPTPTRATTSSRSCASPTSSSTSTRTSTARTPSSPTRSRPVTGRSGRRRQRRHGRARAGDARAAAGRGPVHRGPQPALRRGVVGLRVLRARSSGGATCRTRGRPRRPRPTRYLRTREPRPPGPADPLPLHGHRRRRPPGRADPGRRPARQLRRLRHVGSSQHARPVRRRLDPHEVGEAITTYLGVAHGWLYMIFLVTAFLLSRKAGWDLPFTAGHPGLRHDPDPQLLGRAPRPPPGSAPSTPAPAVPTGG